MKNFEKENARKQILARAKAWLEIKQKELDKAKTEKDKIRLAGEVSAFCQICLDIEFMRIK